MNIYINDVLQENNSSFITCMLIMRLGNSTQTDVWLKREIFSEAVTILVFANY